jgi:hypothetical protein
MELSSLISINNLVFFIIFLVSFLASFKYGKKVYYSLILAFYPTILIFQNSDYLTIKDKNILTIILIAIFAICFFILWKNLQSHSVYDKLKKIITYTLLGLSFMILLSSVSFNIPLIKSLLNLGPISAFIVKYISYDLALIIPLIVVFITSRERV